MHRKISSFRGRKMKLSHLLAGYIICILISTNSAAICYDNLNGDVRRLVKVGCKMENEDVKRGVPPEDQTSPMFRFTINCQSSNTTCSKVRSEFEKAGQ